MFLLGQLEYLCVMRKLVKIQQNGTERLYLCGIWCKLKNFIRATAAQTQIRQIRTISKIKNKSFQ